VYHTCLFCNRDLGRNEVVEQFPVGRRLAFDAARGRLWVVCAQCRRWNLTPMEERWEAIETCERLYRDTRTRVATDNIGLAMEMALHEDDERRAMEGELSALESAWRDAEEIAAIADDLTLPEAVMERLARLRGR
jgi:hypothetical protein